MGSKAPVTPARAQQQVNSLWRSVLVGLSWHLQVPETSAPAAKQQIQLPHCYMTAGLLGDCSADPGDRDLFLRVSIS